MTDGSKTHTLKHSPKIYLTSFPVKTDHFLPSPFLLLYLPILICVCLKGSIWHTTRSSLLLLQSSRTGHTHTHTRTNSHGIFFSVTHPHSFCQPLIQTLSHIHIPLHRGRESESNGTGPKQTSGCPVNHGHIILKRPGTNTHLYTHTVNQTIQNRYDIPENGN